MRCRVSIIAFVVVLFHIHVKIAMFVSILGFDTHVIFHIEFWDACSMLLLHPYCYGSFVDVVAMLLYHVLSL